MNRQWFRIAIVATVAGLAGCPAGGIPICSDCHLQPGGECGEYTLHVTLKPKLGQNAEVINTKLWVDDEAMTLDDPPNPWHENDRFTVPITPGDFPGMCPNGWDGAKVKLKATLETSNDPPEATEDEVPISSR
jgi:hypothetical protein